MRPPKITAEGQERLRKVATLQVQIESTKILSRDLKLTENYIRQLLSKLRRELSNTRSVSRGA